MYVHKKKLISKHKTSIWPPMTYKFDSELEELKFPESNNRKQYKDKEKWKMLLRIVRKILYTMETDIIHIISDQFVNNISIWKDWG